MVAVVVVVVVVVAVMAVVAVVVVALCLPKKASCFVDPHYTQMHQSANCMFSAERSPAMPSGRHASLSSKAELRNVGGLARGVQGSRPESQRRGGRV